MATPLEIEIALWYHCRAGAEDSPGMMDYGQGDGRYDAPAVQSALERMGSCRLLEHVLGPGKPPPHWKAGPALKVYVEALERMPFPV